MKKLLITFVLFTSLISTSFAKNIFSHRFFEFKVDVPVEISNNLIGLTDVLQETVVIDLSKIADNVALRGAALKAGTSPSIGFKLDIPHGLILGLSVGAEADIGVGLSKDLFEFLGKGNVGMENRFKMEASNTYADLFATAKVDGGWNFKKSRLEVSGTAFSALAHFDASGTKAEVYLNDNENSIEFDAKVAANAYTIVQADDLTSVESILNALKNNIGFDVSARYDRDIFKFLTVGAQARIPLVPSKLSVGYVVDYSYSKEIDFDSFLGGEESSEGDSGSSVPKQQEEEETETAEGYAAYLGQPTMLDTPYSIHRPMKFGITADFHPFGSLLTTNGYLGIAFRHPFAAAINKATTGGLDETQFYIDYSLGGRLSLWDILSLSLSHS